jgi:hypothetical protein
MVTKKIYKWRVEKVGIRNRGVNNSTITSFGATDDNILIRPVLLA